MKDIVNLKCSKGHQIKIIKGERPNGYKYIGVYSKPIKEVKNVGKS